MRDDMRAIHRASCIEDAADWSSSSGTGAAATILRPATGTRTWREAIAIQGFRRDLRHTGSRVRPAVDPRSSRVFRRYVARGLRDRQRPSRRVVPERCRSLARDTPSSTPRTGHQCANGEWRRRPSAPWQKRPAPRALPVPREYQCVSRAGGREDRLISGMMLGGAVTLLTAPPPWFRRQCSRSRVPIGAGLPADGSRASISEISPMPLALANSRNWLSTPL